jgi:hypothetical protein
MSNKPFAPVYCTVRDAASRLKADAIYAIAICRKAFHRRRALTRLKGRWHKPSSDQGRANMKGRQPADGVIWLPVVRKPMRRMFRATW